MKRLSDEDIQSLKDEIKEMRQVLAWLDKRIDAESSIGCSAMLCQARDYVRSSIEVFEHDVVFMSEDQD